MCIVSMLVVFFDVVMIVLVVRVVVRFMFGLIVWMVVGLFCGIGMLLSIIGMFVFIMVL